MTVASRLPRQRAIGGQPSIRVALLAANVAMIAGLTIVTIAQGPKPVSMVGQVCFVLLFSALAVLDLRSAAAIALLELVIGGSNGDWTTFPGGIHGRLVLDAIVMLGATATVVADWRRTRILNLGRYGPHAVFLGVVLPAAWMALGLLNGNTPRNVFSDGNGYIFFAFTLVFIVLVKSGHGTWLRHWLLVCCTANALLICALFVVAASGLVAPEPTLREILWNRLGIGHDISYAANGALRLFLASGLYLQVGLALAGGLLLANWRRPWIWALMALFLAALIATYTRGFWVGGAAALLMVIVFGSRNLLQPVRLMGGLLLMFAAASAVGYTVGFSLPNYVLGRAASIAETGGQAPVVPVTSPSAGTTSPPSPSPSVVRPSAPPPTPAPGSDTSGPVSNAIRIVQARILLGHIAERPLLGWGFGTVAPDYPYGSIPSYELAFLDLAYKTGLIGLILWLSFPVRLLLALVQARMRRIRLPDGLPAVAAAAPIAIVASVLVTGSTNPYILASYGLLPIIWSVVWLEPAGGRARVAASAGDSTP